MHLPQSHIYLDENERGWNYLQTIYSVLSSYFFVCPSIFWMSSGFVYCDYYKSDNGSYISGNNNSSIAFFYYHLNWFLCRKNILLVLRSLPYSGYSLAATGDGKTCELRPDGNQVLFYLNQDESCRIASCVVCPRSAWFYKL